MTSRAVESLGADMFLNTGNSTTGNDVGQVCFLVLNGQEAKVKLSLPCVSALGEATHDVLYLIHDGRVP
jgi:hypothetical protein